MYILCICIYQLQSPPNQTLGYKSNKICKGLYQYNENYKMLMKEVKKNLKKQKDIVCSCIGRINIIKILILPKLICINKDLIQFL